MDIFRLEAAQSATYDPNWFLSTVVQSTAGFIAIMAGFQLSRLVSLNSEKRSLENRISDTHTRREIAQDEFNSSSQIINTRTFRWLEEDILDDLIRDPDRDIADLVGEHLYRGSDENLMVAYANELVIKIRSFEDQISAVSQPPSFPPVSEEELHLKGISTTNDLELKIALGVAKRLAEPRKQKLGILIPHSTNLYKSLPNEKQIARHDDQIARREGIREQLKYIDAELESLKTQLKNIPSSKSMLHGFGILLYFGIVGVLIPLFKMSHNPTIADINFRSFVLWTYSIGFGWLLFYIFKLNHQLLTSRKFE
jgi:hypothetical protein